MALYPRGIIIVQKMIMFITCATDGSVIFEDTATGEFTTTTLTLYCTVSFNTVNNLAAVAGWGTLAKNRAVGCISVIYVYGGSPSSDGWLLCPPPIIT